MSKANSENLEQENNVSADVKRLFDSLDTDGSATVSSHFLLNFLEQTGIQKDDPRLEAMIEEFDKFDAVKSDKQLNLGEFARAVDSCGVLCHQAFAGDLKIPNFEELTEIITEVYNEVEQNKSGANATYIPQLAQVDPEQFSISITTTDGQHFSIGDMDKQFCIQSCSKPISYLIGLNNFGTEYVHNHVGTEPSGHAFNYMGLKDAPEEENPGKGIPHNPCINSGAMMMCSMVYPEIESRQERLEKVLDCWKELSGGPHAPIGFDEETYKSESGSADRNWCLAYMMRERNSWPPCFDMIGKEAVTETLELYFQICSILSTNKAMSIMASTLANGGMNPLSGKRIMEPEHVRCALPLMLTCGMYDYSGQWAFDVGIPAKSGVGGCVFMVVPNLMGISVWSPRLDEIGNTVRGVATAKALCERLQVHNFEVFSGLSRKKLDPTKNKYWAREKEIGLLLEAASSGDMNSLVTQASAGTNLYVADYDLRTAIHLAAVSGHATVLEFLINNAPVEGRSELLSMKDRWGATPLDEAEHNDNQMCTQLLKKHGAVNGDNEHLQGDLREEGKEKETAHNVQVFWAAAEGNVSELIRQNNASQSLFAADYDSRTPLMLAASNGHVKAVQYILVQARKQLSTSEFRSFIRSEDAFGGTALEDAIREGHKECQDELEKSRWNEDVKIEMFDEVTGQFQEEGFKRIQEQFQHKVETHHAKPGDEKEVIKRIISSHKTEMDNLELAIQDDAREIEKLIKENAALALRNTRKASKPTSGIKGKSR